MQQIKVLLTLNQEKVREGVVNRLMALDTGVSEIRRAEYDGMFFEVVVDVQGPDDVLEFMGILQREMPEVTIVASTPTTEGSDAS